MTAPFIECEKCVAVDFCKIYSGENKFSYYREYCGIDRIFDKVLKLANMPRAFHKANLFTYKLDKYNQSTYDEIVQIVDNIGSFVSEGRNVFLYSKKTGTGKTHNACVLLNHYIYDCLKNETLDIEYPTVLFVSYVDLISKLRYERKNMAEEIETIKTVPLLLLDDVGAGTMSDYAREQTMIIVDYRYNNNLSTIVTTNISPKELEGKDLLGARTVSRLLHNCVGITVNGRDRRVVK